VSNVATEEAPKASLGEAWLGFLDGSVETSGASVRTDPSGAFRIAALTPGLYDVLFVPSTRTSGYYDPRTQGIRVEAPVANLELESPIRVYSLRVTAEEGPVADAMVCYYVPDGSVAGPTESDGRYSFFMANSDTRHRVAIEKPGFAPRELLLGPGDFDSEGSLEVELERTAPACELTLELALSPGPIGLLGLRMNLSGSEWYLFRAPSRAGATIALGEVPAGRYRLEAWPEVDDALEPAKQGLWLPTEMEVVCAPSSSERVRVELRQAGRAVFHVTGIGAGAAGAGTWSLRGPDGHGPLSLMAWDANQSALQTLWSPLEIERDGEYWLRRALLPGEYRLDVTFEGELRTESQAFFVVAGDVTDVLLEL
jgi:hypothetical protein